MPNATVKLAAIGLAVAVMAACQRAPDQANAASQDMSIDDNLSGQQDRNIAIETLPADESSATSNAELSAGATDPDADPGSNNSSE